jgi:hypothetical protein
MAPGPGQAREGDVTLHDDEEVDVVKELVQLGLHLIQLLQEREDLDEGKGACSSKQFCVGSAANNNIRGLLSSQHPLFGPKKFYKENINPGISYIYIYI